MHIIRPIRTSDLDDFVKLVNEISFGISSLPKDKEVLQKKVSESEESFGKTIKEPGGETYLFALEELDTGKLIGVSGIVSKVGGFDPFYTYKIEKVTHESKTLNVHKEVKILNLVAEHNGPCEIGSLYLLPQKRKSGMGLFLSLSRFLFMAENKNLFDPYVIAEMRGVIDKKGQSPFWEAIGRHFFDIDFSKADYLSVVNKKLIAELMPKNPIYVPLLPKKAQEVIGDVHKNTKPALKILEGEGFKFDNMIGVFEGGPVISSNLKNIRSVKESVKSPVFEIRDEKIESDMFIISSGTKKDFRATLGNLDTDSSGRICIESKTALALNVKIDDHVRFVSFYSQPSKKEK